MRSLLFAMTLALAAPMAISTPLPAHAGLKKIKKKFKKTSKKVKKVSNKTIKKTRKTLKKVGVTVNSATGEVSGLIKEGVDLTKDELKKSLKVAEKGLKSASKTIERAAEKAIMAAYKKAYKQAVGKYAKLFGLFIKNQAKLVPKITQIGLHLAQGNNKKVAELIESLRDHKLMKALNKQAHKLMGTSLVITVDVSVGTNFVAGSGVRGVAINLSPKGKPKVSFFVAAGGVLTSEAKPNAGTGISIGFLKGDPSNISGVFIDAAASVSLSPAISGTVALSWAPPSKKSPYIKPVPVMTMYGLGAGVGGTSSSPGAVSLGGSYTWITQRTKN